MIRYSIPLDDIEALLDYNWVDEENDYDEHEDEREGHIFERMKRIAKWVDAMRETEP